MEFGEYNKMAYLLKQVERKLFRLLVTLKCESILSSIRERQGLQILCGENEPSNCWRQDILQRHPSSKACCRSASSQCALGKNCSWLFSVPFKYFAASITIEGPCAGPGRSLLNARTDTARSSFTSSSNGQIWVDQSEYPECTTLI